MFPKSFSNFTFYQKKKDILIYKAADSNHQYILKCSENTTPALKQERSQNGRMSGHILSFYRMDDKVKALILHEDCHIIRKQKEEEVCEGDIFANAGTNIEILQIKR